MEKPAGLPSTIFSKKKSGAGFTLIEILVSVAISGILFGVGIAAFRGIGARQNLKQAGNEFQSNLRLIQQKTLSSQKPDGCDVLLEYKVSYYDDNTYLVKPICQNGILIEKPVDLLENVRFEVLSPPPPPPFTPISFLVLQAGVVGAQMITLTNGSLDYEVTIGPKGVITGEMH